MGLFWLCTGYMLLGLLSSLVFRAVRDALPNNPTAQERILGASLTAMAIADVCSKLLSEEYGNELISLVFVSQATQ